MSTGGGFILGWFLRGLFSGRSKSRDDGENEYSCSSNFFMHSCTDYFDVSTTKEDRIEKVNTTKAIKIVEKSIEDKK